MDVSVIIISYNTCNLTLQSIESVYKLTQGVDFEVIIVDNNSTDESVTQIKLRFPEVVLIENNVNEGFGRANNRGANVAKGEFLFLLNSDAYLTSNSILEFYNYMKQHSNVGVLGGELSTGKDYPTVSYGNLPSLFEYFSYLGFKKFYPNYFETKLASGIVNKTQDIKTVGYVNGADMFIRKSVFDNVGGFDSDFFLYFEETELSYRIQKAGFKSVILPSEKIIHLVSFYRENELDFNFNKHKIYSQSRFMYFKKCHGVVIAYIANVLIAGIHLFQGILRKDRGNYKKKAWIALTSKEFVWN